MARLKGSPNLLLTCRGESRSLKEWSVLLSLPYSRLYNRYRKGWTPEEILEFEAPPVTELLVERQRTNASYNQQPKVKPPTDLSVQHPNSIVYAVIDGQVVKIDRAPGWMRSEWQ